MYHSLSKCDRLNWNFFFLVRSSDRDLKKMMTTTTLVFTLWCLVVVVVRVEGKSTFLLVTQNVAPPPSTASLGASTTSLAGCGLACFNADAESNATCLAFFWTPTPVGNFWYS